MTTRGAAMVFAALKSRGCPALEMLEVSDNRGLGGGPGLRALLGVATEGACPALEVIGLQRCSLGDEDFEALAAALPHLPALQSIYADTNGCGDAGALALAAALPAARALEILCMSGNGMVGAAAAAALLAAAAGLGLGEWDTGTRKGYCGPEQQFFGPQQ